MKRWQVEQILYLNDTGKTKLVLPQSQYLPGSPFRDGFLLNKENILVVLLRKWISLLLKVL